MKLLISRLIRDDHGQDLIEYAFLATFIGAAVSAALVAVGEALNTQYSNISSQVSSAS